MSNVSLNRVSRRPTGPTSRSNSGQVRNVEHSSAIGDIDSVENSQLNFFDLGADYLHDQPPESKQSPIEPITEQLGHTLTFANPVWSGDPIPGLRSLQKKLIELALSLNSESREPCLQAISVVENAVRMRLRLQQMRMDELSTDSGAEA